MLKTFGRILEFWKPHKALGFGLVVTMMLRAVFTLVFALAIGFVIDLVIEPDPGVTIEFVVGVLLVGFTVSVLAGFTAARLSAKATSRIMADVRTSVFVHLQWLPLRFHDRAMTGNLISHFSTDLAELSKGVIKNPLVGLRSLTAMALYLPVMFLLDVRLALISVVVLPIIVYLVYRFAPDSEAALDEEKQRIADVLEEVSGNLRAQKIIRAYSLRDRSIRRFSLKVETLRGASEKAEGRIGVEMVISEYAVEFARLAIIGVGASFALSGSLDPGAFAAFAAILTEFAWESGVFGIEVLPSIKQSEAGIRRIDALLAVPMAEDRQDGQAPPDMDSVITFSNVVFRYRSDREPQLKGVSVEIPARSYVAIVGPNGSGKSSMLSVLLDLYDLEEGAVLVDGLDLATVDGDQMRRMVGVAFQDTYLFDGTLEANVTLGDEECSPESVGRALVDSGLASVIASLPDGAQTTLDSGETLLSTGETQRVGIARALAREPRLLLLDEVASGLDPEAEADLIGAIERLREGRTVISVTHRLESVKTADLIVVLDGGVVVETGTFEALLGSGGPFSTMWTKQHGFDVSANGLSARVRPERLRKIPLFADLDLPVLEDISSAFETRLVDDGEIVFRQGGLGDSFYVIARGVVEVVRDIGDPSEEVIAWLEDGDFFGEMALLGRQRRNASVRARGITTLLVLDKRQFDQLMATVPEARTAIEAAAAERERINSDSAGSPNPF
ncbi:MAG TPA: ABC transporter transmembrane domain-containing protein [Acidimicrobiia bacterium]|nr:ABC transporter transmembrane domain-containing protein [Acidimicrobiia bacterium]